MPAGDPARIGREPVVWQQAVIRPVEVMGVPEVVAGGTRNCCTTHAQGRGLPCSDAPPEQLASGGWHGG
jgi:hypothetical protein